MAPGDGEGKERAFPNQLRDFLRLVDQFALGGKAEVPGGGVDEQGVVGAFFGNEAVGIFRRQVRRQGGFFHVAHAVQRVAQGEDGAAGFCQAAVAVSLVLPPAVLLAVDFLGAAFLRQAAVHGKVRLGGLVGSLFVGDGDVQLVFSRLPGPVCGHEMRARLGFHDLGSVHVQGILGLMQRPGVHRDVNSIADGDGVGAEGQFDFSLRQQRRFMGQYGKPVIMGDERHLARFRVHQRAEQVLILVVEKTAAVIPVFHGGDAVELFLAKRLVLFPQSGFGLGQGFRAGHAVRFLVGILRPGQGQRRRGHIAAHALGHDHQALAFLDQSDGYFITGIQGGNALILGVRGNIYLRLLYGNRRFLHPRDFAGGFFLLVGQGLGFHIAGHAVAGNLCPIAFCFLHQHGFPGPDGQRHGGAFLAFRGTGQHQQHAFVGVDFFAHHVFRQLQIFRFDIAAFLFVRDFRPRFPHFLHVHHRFIGNGFQQLALVVGGFAHIQRPLGRHHPGRFRQRRAYHQAQQRHGGDQNKCFPCFHFRKPSQSAEKAD